MIQAYCDPTEPYVTHSVYPFRIETYLLPRDYIAHLQQHVGKTNAAPMFGHKPGTLRFSEVNGECRSCGRWVIEGSFAHDPNGFSVVLLQPNRKRVRRKSLYHRAELRYIVPRKPRRLRVSKQS